MNARTKSNAAQQARKTCRLLEVEKSFFFELLKKNDSTYIKALLKRRGVEKTAGASPLAVLDKHRGQTGTQYSVVCDTLAGGRGSHSSPIVSAAFA